MEELGNLDASENSMLEDSVQRKTWRRKIGENFHVPKCEDHTVKLSGGDYGIRESTQNAGPTCKE